MRPLINPMDRPHWSSLNRGQQLYAMRQHNIARNRRGLPPIDFPGGQNDRGHSPPRPSQNVPSPTPSQELQAAIDDAEGPTPAFIEEILNEPSFGEEDEEDLLEAYNLLIAQYPEVFPDENMVLPGVAGEERVTSSNGAKRARVDSTASAGTEAGASGGGAGGVSGGTGGGYVIPRPFVSECQLFRTFKKTHKFLTYGMANVRLNKDITVPAIGKMYYLTTSLARIPVQKPYLYMMPGEFLNLDVNTRCVEVKVRVTQRNIRVAFETAASTSTLATLNQNKNGCTAVGLNKLPYIMNASYTIDAADSMKPTAVVLNVQEPNVSQLYGVTSGGAAAATVPNSLVGAPVALREYAVVAIRTNEGPAAVGPANGWPDLQTHIKQYDAADFVGAVVAEYSYKPKEGWLKRPTRWNYMGAGIPDSIIRTRAHYQGATTMECGVNGSATYAVGDSILAPPAADNLSITDDIEKSEWIMGKTDKGLPQLQPSLHVGVMAVPSLTTAANSTVPTAWTDVQAYFDVECEMTVVWDKRAEFSGEANTRMPEQWYPSDIIQAANAASWNNITRLGVLSQTRPEFM